jgi:hypothetical protein
MQVQQCVPASGAWCALTCIQHSLSASARLAKLILVTALIASALYASAAVRAYMQCATAAFNSRGVRRHFAQRIASCMRSVGHVDAVSAARTLVAM